uniref:Putative conserved secreted protein n=1 Tax=Amblyomma tuberculatum TaxID=48802 RepID=A0A6M2E185_9ACAR
MRTLVTLPSVLAAFTVVISCIFPEMPTVIPKVTFVDVNCTYDGTPVPNGQSSTPEGECKNMTCINGNLKIEECRQISSKDSNCTLTNGTEATFPLCCPSLYCE